MRTLKKRNYGRKSRRTLKKRNYSRKSRRTLKRGGRRKLRRNLKRGGKKSEIKKIMREIKDVAEEYIGSDRKRVVGSEFDLAIDINNILCKKNKRKVGPSILSDDLKNSSSGRSEFIKMALNLISAVSPTSTTNTDFNCEAVSQQLIERAIESKAKKGEEVLIPPLLKKWMANCLEEQEKAGVEGWGQQFGKCTEKQSKLRAKLMK